LSPVMPIVLGNALKFSGRLQEASHWYEESLRLAPEWFSALGNLSNLRLRQGRFDEARDLAIRAIKNVGGSEGDIDYQLASIDVKAGKRPRDEAIALVLASKTAFCSAVDQPYWLALMGAYEQALETLRHCRDQGDPYAAFANVLPAYEPMRQMPEFQAYLKELGLWDEPMPEAGE